MRVGFAGFVLLHLSCQAYRAFSDSAIPSAGLEVQPWFVAALLLLVWLPFLVFAGRELKRVRLAASASAEQRALAVVEPFALLVVLAFAVLHGVQVVWPLLSGTAAPEDVRPELIASISATRAGIPVQAIATLLSVGAASFYAVRQVLKALPEAPRSVRRGLVSLGVLGYALGSYAVIRLASGAILP